MIGKFLKMAPEGEDGGAGAGGGNQTPNTSPTGGFSLTAGGSQGDIKRPGAESAGAPGAGAGDNRGADVAGGSPAAGGDSGQGSQDWRTNLSPDLQKNKSLEKFKDQNAMAQAYLSMERMTSSRGITIPNEKTATKEDWDNFYKQVGRPEKAEAYELKEPEEAKGIQLTPEFKEWYKKTAHEHGLTKKQAESVYGAYMKEIANSGAKAQEQAQKAGRGMIAELEKDWGADLEVNVNKAQVAVSEFVKDDRVINWMKTATVDGMKLDNHPMFARIMAEVGGALAEDKFRGGKGANIGKTVAEIDKEIETLTADLKGPYNDPNHGAYHSTRQHVLSLRQEKNRMMEKSKRK